MTYDQWKTTDPDDPMWDECEQCRRRGPGERFWVMEGKLLCEQCCQDIEGFPVQDIETYRVVVDPVDGPVEVIDPGTPHV